MSLARVEMVRRRDDRAFKIGKRRLRGSREHGGFPRRDVAFEFVRIGSKDDVNEHAPKA